MKTTTDLLVLFALCASATAAVRGGDESKESAYEHPFETDEHRTPTLDTSPGALIRNVTIHSAVDRAQESETESQDEEGHEKYRGDGGAFLAAAPGRAGLRGALGENTA